MYLFNAAGFCWDGESGDKKYKMCIDEIIPSLHLGKLKFDSVYVFSQRFYNDADSIHTQIYMSKLYPLFLKRARSIRGQLTEIEEITSFTEN